MGFRCGNVQVFTNQLPAQEVRAAVIEAVRGWIGSTGEFEEIPAGSGESRPDRAVIIGPATTEPWIAVFDEFGEEDSDLTGALAKTLSAASPGKLALGIFASSDLELYLYQNGQFVDGYSDIHTWRDEDDLPKDPDQFQMAEQARLDKLVGQPALWEPVLATDYTPAALKDIWQKLILKEERLEELAPVLALNPDLCLSSYNYMYVEDEEIASDDYTVLTFRSTRRPEETYLAKAEGLPRFEMFGGTAKLTLNAGEIFNTSVFYVANRGGAGQGVQIVIWGEAIEQGVLEPATLEVYPANFSQLALQTPRLADNPAALPQKVPLIAATSQDGQKIYYVKLPQQDIPAGLLNIQAAQQQQPFYKSWQAQDSTHLNFAISGRAKTAGQTSLHIAFTPMQNAEGATSWTIPVEVFPAPKRQPIRVIQHPSLHSYSLRSLEPSDKLAAIIVLGQDWREKTGVISSILESWNEILVQRAYEVAETEKAGGKKTTKPRLRYDVIFNSTPVTPQIQMLRLKANEIPQDANWQKLQSKMGESSLVLAMLPSPEDSSSFPPRLANSGFTLSSNAYGLSRMDGQGQNKKGDKPADWVTHFNLWIDLKGLSQESQQAAETKLNQLVDSLMGQVEVLQAALVRWDWSYNVTDQSNPYETLAGVGSQVNSREWCSHFLRALSEQMWLSQPLLEHLADPATLASVAQITPIGTGLKLKLEERHTMDDLEEILAPIVPIRFTSTNQQ